jgi:hypothetical protein
LAFLSHYSRTFGVFASRWWRWLREQPRSGKIERVRDPLAVVVGKFRTPGQATRQPRFAYPKAGSETVSGAHLRDCPQQIWKFHEVPPQKQASGIREGAVEKFRIAVTPDA